MVQKLGKYRIEETLGEGSFAHVYRAKDEALNRYVALKVLKPAWLSDLAAIERFKHEARILAQLEHRHIALVYEVGEDQGQVYMAQRLVEGETLAKRLARDPLSWAETLNILRPIAAALDYAHQQGLIHRDIKPSNILLDQKGQVFLSDFGLVRAAEGSASLSASVGGVKGTASYIPPEIWDGEPATPATDVYALSCVVFEMLTSRVLFAGSSMMAVLGQHYKGPQFPETWPEGVPPGVSQVLERGLAATPADRISQAGTLLAELQALTLAPTSAKVESQPKPGATPAPAAPEATPEQKMPTFTPPPTPTTSSLSPSAAGGSANRFLRGGRAALLGVGYWWPSGLGGHLPTNLKIAKFFGLLGTPLNGNIARSRLK